MTKAKSVIRKYDLITKFLADVLKVDKKNLHHEACNLEHAVSDNVMKKLELFMKKNK